MDNFLISTEQFDIETDCSLEQVGDILRELSNLKQGCLNQRRVISLVTIAELERSLSFEIVSKRPNSRYKNRRFGFRYTQYGKVMGAIEFDSATKARLNLSFQMGSKSLWLQILAILVFDIAVFLFICLLSWSQLLVILFLFAFGYSLLSLISVWHIYKDTGYLKSCIFNALARLEEIPCQKEKRKAHNKIS